MDLQSHEPRSQFDQGSRRVSCCSSLMNFSVRSPFCKRLLSLKRWFLLEARGLLNQLRYEMQFHLIFKHSTQTASSFTMAVCKVIFEQKAKVIIRMSDNMREGFHVTYATTKN